MKFNNTKKIMAIILAAVMICVTFVGCSKNKNADVDVEASSNIAENVSKEDETEASTEAPTEATTEATTQKETTTQRPETTTKKQVTTTEKTETTTKKKPAQTTTKPASKPTTTKPQTTVKHVNIKDVQNEANNYIKTKGIKLDSSLTPDSAGWNGRISALQQDLDNGYTLRTCKEEIGLVIDEWNPNCMYCYTDAVNGYCYILYIGSVG